MTSFWEYFAKHENSILMLPADFNSKAMITLLNRGNMIKWPLIDLSKVLKKITHLTLVAIIASPLSAYSIDDRADTDPNDDLDPDEKISWKTTISSYRDSLHGDAYDLNMRGNTEKLTFWLGQYSHANVFKQTRLGMEYSHALPLGRLVGSVQIATENFLGWSLTWDGKKAGQHGFGPMVGIGRTNLKPYYNLNFDPNDSVLIGGSYSSPSNGAFTLYRISDDRLHTGQQTTHLVWRRSLPEGKRLTLDAFARKGASEPGGTVYRGKGAMMTLDVNDWFMRVGYDPKANWTPSNIVRMAIGFRH
jgi:hypothetical protein